MNKLKLTLSPLNGVSFRISADKYGSENSTLPFSDGEGDSNLFTVLNALNTISTKYQGSQNDD